MTSVAHAFGPAVSTIPELIRARTDLHGDHVGYGWLSTGDEADGSLTWTDLDRRARAIASHLQGRNLRGERALLLFRPGLEFATAFFGCLQAGVIAVPAYVPRQERDMARTLAIASDARPRMVLTTSADLSVRTVCSMDDAEWVAVDDIQTAEGEGWRGPAIRQDDIAYLQYTSGSTSTPKGVILSHRNVLANVASLAEDGAIDRDTVAVSWLPHFHDMGLVYGYVLPMFCGFPAYLMPPASFIQRPACWLRAITRFRGTHCGGPNFAYDLCVERVSDEERATLDLQSWRVAFNGAEAIRAATLKRFAKRFEPCGFRRQAFFPVYGLAEATLKVTSVQPDRGATTCRIDPMASRLRIAGEEDDGDRLSTLVSCGAVGRGDRVAIVSPTTGEDVGSDAIGEIWVSGPSVAAGYWNRPDESRQTFQARLPGTEAPPFLRTGDLGFLHGGELFVAGRLKDTIITHGRNLCAEDIEATVERCHPVLRHGACAAFGYEDGDEERLAIACELPRGSHDAASLVAAIRRAVNHVHGVPPHAIDLLPPRALSRTSSGKLQRHACRHEFLAGTHAAVHRWRAADRTARIMEQAPARDAVVTMPEADRHAALESYLTSAIAQLLDGPDQQVRPEDVPVAIGIDSLKAAQLSYDAERRFGSAVPAAVILGPSTIRELTRDLVRTLGATPPAADAAISGHGGAISHGQSALWFLQQVKPESSAWHISRAVRLAGPLDADALRESLHSLVDRHAALRTTFPAVRGVPVARTTARAREIVEYVDAERWTGAMLRRRIEEDANAAFDLARGPLFRAWLYRQSPREHILLVSVHHIVSDFQSMALLARQLMAGYLARIGGHAQADAPPTPDTGFAEWQRALVAGPEGARLLEYWGRTLAGTLPVTTLPAEPGAAGVQPGTRGAETCRLDAEIALALAAFASQSNVTLNATLLALFLVLLHRSTGEGELLIGCTADARSSARFASAVGYCVNTLPIRIDVSDDPTFQQLVLRVGRTMVDALAHGAMPFARIVEHVQPHRDASLSPLIRTMFACHEETGPGSSLAGLAAGDPATVLRFGPVTAHALPACQRMTQFDLTFTVAHHAGHVTACVEGDLSRVTLPTLERLAARFEDIARASLLAPGTRVSALPIVGERERRELLAWNATDTPYPAVALHDLVAAQVASAPDRIALVCGDDAVTYGALWERACQLAVALRAEGGVGPESIVGLCAERSIEMVAGMLGILVAGAAYLPLDPDHPDARLVDMLDAAGAGVALCQPRFAPRLTGASAAVLPLEPLEASLARPRESARTGRWRAVDPDHLAYAMFTSGSTGRPKGALVTHRAIANRIQWMRAAYPLEASDVVLQKTPFGFDVSVWEFFLPLASGARLVLARPGGHRDPAYLVRTIREQQVTMLHFVPSMLAIVLDEPGWRACTTIRHLICSGEALPASLVSRVHASSRAALHNLYGPTEAAVDVTAWTADATRAHQVIPIGRPIANAAIHVLDRDLHPVPIGAPGDLYIGGTPVGRGYVRRPSLTAAAFIPDPFATAPGARLYRTGDRARFLADGEIEYLGRLDAQVKIRGQRVELGEIEAVVQRQPDVIACAVLVDETTGDSQLVAHVVTRSQDPGLARRLRVALHATLPEFMVPARFIRHDAPALSANGKLDRVRLAQLRGELLIDAHERTEPATAVERTLLQLWSELLDTPVESVDQGFFEL
jgi:amino acid adenylation domain-containing protein